jgi:sulfite exporter TauE/SafE
MIAALSILFAQAQRHGMFDRFPLAEAGMGVPLLFLAGLLTSVHCVAMCGGICLTQTVRGARHPLLPGALYNLGRVVSYTVIGGIVGAVGTVVQPSGMFRGAVQLIAGAFMIIMGLSMLGLFPRLNRLVPRMPARFAGMVDGAKTRAAGPFVVGLLNGLMPCGPLQAMQLYALSSGSAARGALGMLAFSLGTVPLMLGLGALASALGRRFTRRAMAAGAVLVAVLGISMFSQGFRLSGQSNVTADVGGSAARTEDVQVVNSTLSSGAYPDITVRAGVPVRWVIDAPQGSVNGCNYDMVIGVYGIEYQFQTGENVIEFTPTQAGAYDYTCWMGMISGTITVVDDKTQGGLEE